VEEWGGGKRKEKNMEMKSKKIPATYASLVSW
jgi:hypothetical protein